MRPAYLLPFILLISLKLFSQPVINNDTTYFIKGKVYVDFMGNKEAISGAVVGIKNTGIGCITDSLGNFIIKGLKSGTYKIDSHSLDANSIDTSIILYNQSIDNLMLTLPIICSKISPQKAKEDIKNNKAKLYLSGSIAPVYYPGQENFENKYDVEYYELGDNLEESLGCNESYNKIIFKYLDEKFGAAWRKEVRKDVLGFTKK
ncbi:MAG: carboxypeptidase-like regulatory domain-containing protein [Ignavibacteria bacterium]|nr:carboxypeptidase-like regulatory domain-containing protein [Ignavibacteria bacterium]